MIRRRPWRRACRTPRPESRTPRCCRRSAVSSTTAFLRLPCLARGRAVRADRRGAVHGRSGAVAGGLSLAPEHRRGHGALYDPVGHGRLDVDRLRRALDRLPLPRAADGRLVLAADVSPWLRPDAATSSERLFCHVYGRAKGQSQLIPGWPYASPPPRTNASNQVSGSPRDSNRTARGCCRVRPRWRVARRTARRLQQDDVAEPASGISARAEAIRMVATWSSSRGSNRLEPTTGGL